MIFKSICIQNFMSIREAHIELDNQGLVLIRGVNDDNPSFVSNGAGKSTIIESIVYVLFGRTIRGVKGDDVVSKVSKKNCKVILDIIDNGSEYRIARYRKHHQNKNSVFLYCNGIDITPKSEADFTKSIIELLQTDFMTFTSSILYSAESFKFTQATDSELKSAFDVMLDLKVYSECQEEVKSQLRELSSEKKELSNRTIDVDRRKSYLEGSVEKTKVLSDKYESDKEAEIDALTETIETLEKQKSEVDEKLKEIQDSIRKIQSDIAVLVSKKKKHSDTEQALKTLRENIEEDEDEKLSIKSKIRKVNNLITKYKDSISDNCQSISKSKKKIKKYEDSLVELKKTVGTPCPTCGKPLDETHISEAVEECKYQINEETSKIKDFEIDTEECHENVRKCEEELSTLNLELDEVNSEIEEYRHLLVKVQERLKSEQQIETKILEKERELNRIEREYDKKKLSKDSFDSKIELKQSQIEKLASEDNPYTKQIEELFNSIDELNPEYESLKEELDALLSEEYILNFWLQGFSNSGIKSMLLDDITPFLNSRANKYLKVLSGDNLSVNFTTQTKLKSGELREKFQIELINKDGGDSYLSNSSGEKRRVDVAINLALCDLIASRANKKINITFCDEIFDALDSNGIDSVMGLLRTMSEDKSSIFVISHNEQIQSYFEKTLTVTKKNGCSTVVFEG